MFKGEKLKTKVLHTGLVNATPVAVQPTQEELANLFGTEVKEPKYVFGNNGNEGTRMDIYMKIKESGSIVKTSFFLSNRERKSLAGKPLWINNQGQTVWINEPSDLDEIGRKYFNLDSPYRVSRQGEAELVQYLLALDMVSPNNSSTEAKLPYNWDEIVENPQVMSNGIMATQNHVLALLGVQNGAYQSIFSGYFQAATGTLNVKSWQNALSNGWKNHEWSFPYKEYTPNIPEAQPQVQSIDELLDN